MPSAATPTRTHANAAFMLTLSCDALAYLLALFSASWTEPVQRQLLDAIQHDGVGRGTTAHPGDDQFRAGQHAPELIVQLTRQMGLLVFLRSQKVAGQSTQLDRATQHLVLEVVVPLGALQVVQAKVRNVKDEGYGTQHCQCRHRDAVDPQRIRDRDARGSLTAVSISRKVCSMSADMRSAAAWPSLPDASRKFDTVARIGGIPSFAASSGARYSMRSVSR